jgi:branched-chain amino acid transport system substrate-binding protein
VQAFAALEAVYAKAIEANAGTWPDKEQIADAMTGLEFQGFGRPLTIREDGQAVEAQLVGTTGTSDEFPFKTIKNIEIYDAEPLMPPVGEESLDWISDFEPGRLDISGTRFEQ